ncbi:MAG: hypothetical protein ACRDVW_08420 [Acidimicrobiales bacterium]
MLFVKIAVVALDGGGVPACQVGHRAWAGGVGSLSGLSALGALVRVLLAG